MLLPKHVQFKQLDHLNPQSRLLHLVMPFRIVGALLLYMALDLDMLPVMGLELGLRREGTSSAHAVE